MKKEEIRREAIKLRFKHKSYARVQRTLEERYEYKASRKTIKLWWKRFNQGNWDLKDKSRRPKTIHYKFYAEEIKCLIELRKIKGYSSYQLKRRLEKEGIFMSESTITRAVKNYGLSRGNKMEGQRLKWVRFERDAPNSMWQIDGTGYHGLWLVPVIDDCSRYCIAIGLFENNTTENMIKLLEEAIEKLGKPREILTDNGCEFGGTGSGGNEFDKWCEKQEIKHIRSGIHKPTTVGKIGRLQFTIFSELPYCFNDLEYFRWRYNCDRPHRSLNGLTPNQIYFEYTRHRKYLLERKETINGAGGNMW